MPSVFSEGFTNNHGILMGAYCLLAYLLACCCCCLLLAAACCFCLLLLAAACCCLPAGASILPKKKTTVLVALFGAGGRYGRETPAERECVCFWLVGLKHCGRIARAG